MTSPFPTSPLWPGTWEAATFTGQILDIDNALASHVRLSLKPDVTVALVSDVHAQVVLPLERQIPVNPYTGEFTVAIPATDSADVRPAGWKYTLRVAFDDPRMPAITVGMDAPAGTVVNLRDVMALAAPAPGRDALSESLIAGLVHDLIVAGPGITVTWTGSQMVISSGGGGVTPTGAAYPSADMYPSPLLYPGG